MNEAALENGEGMGGLFDDIEVQIHRAIIQRERNRGGFSRQRCCRGDGRTALQAIGCDSAICRYLHAQHRRPGTEPDGAFIPGQRHAPRGLEVIPAISRPSAQVSELLVHAATVAKGTGRPCPSMGARVRFTISAHHAENSHNKLRTFCELVACS